MKKKRYLGDSEPELDVHRAGSYAWHRQQRGAAEYARFLLAISGDELYLENRAYGAGRLVGRLEGLRTALRTLLEYRFGKTAVAKRLGELNLIDEPRVLERYFLWALRSQTLTQFLSFEVLC
jgi:hypothetical protein